MRFLLYIVINVLEISRVYCCSVAQSCLTFCDPTDRKHARLHCPSPSPAACSNSCPLSQWCHPPILYSVVPFSSCLQSFPASGSFQMSQFFASGGQSTGASAPLVLIGLISLQSRDSQESSPAPQFKSINSLALSLPYGPTLTSIHNFWKSHSFD